MIGIFTERVRKVMGWCPNSSAIKTNETMQFADLSINEPDRGGKTTHVGAGWLNKYRNRVILELLLLMYLAVVTFYEYGKVNPDMYLIGVISGLFFHILTGVNDWHRYNRAAVRGIARPQPTLKQLVITFPVIIILIAFVAFLITNVIGGMTFISGTMVFVWIKILEVLYWEHKNGKTLIVDKLSFFAVDINTLRTE